MLFFCPGLTSVCCDVHCSLIRLCLSSWYPSQLAPRPGAQLIWIIIAEIRPEHNSMGKQEGRTCGHLRRKQKPRKNIKQDSTADPTHKIQKVSATPLCVGGRQARDKYATTNWEQFLHILLCCSMCFLERFAQILREQRSAQILHKLRAGVTRAFWVCLRELRAAWPAQLLRKLCL